METSGSSVLKGHQHIQELASSNPWRCSRRSTTQVRGTLHTLGAAEPPSPRIACSLAEQKPHSCGHRAEAAGRLVGGAETLNGLVSHLQVTVEKGGALAWLWKSPAQEERGSQPHTRPTAQNTQRVPKIQNSKYLTKDERSGQTPNQKKIHRWQISLSKMRMIKILAMKTMR